MKLEYRKHITRDMVQAERDKLFVFGDNQERLELGGQAKEMRGEPNSFGIETKKNSYRYCDGDLWDFGFLIQDLAALRGLIMTGRSGTIVWPADGIGTGLADLKTHWPEGLALIEAFRACLERACR